MTKIIILHCSTKRVMEIYKVLSNYKVQLSIVTNTKYELNYFVRNRNADIVILDPNFIKDNYDGIYIAKRIKIINRKTLTIFISDKWNNETLLNIINNAEPFAFVNHNNLAKELPEALNKAISILTKDSILFTYNKRNEKYNVSLTNVLYFCSIHRTIQYTCINGSTDSFYDKLDNLEDIVKQLTDCFIRISQSYLINRNYIVFYDNNSVKMINGDILSIGRKYHKCLNVIKGICEE